MISSAIKEPVSQPPNANASVAQKSMSFKCVLGTKFVSVKEVAEPNALQAYTPMTTRITTGTHIPKDPTLCNHFPTFSPTTFIIVITTSARIENHM